MAMRYYLGTMEALTKVWRALDQLGDFPKPTAMPSPPRPPVWYEGAIGWTGHLTIAPVEVEPGMGMLYLVEGDPYLEPLLGQSTDIDGETITVPTAAELLYREQLPPEYQAWLDAQEPPPPEPPVADELARTRAALLLVLQAMILLVPH